MEEVEEAEGEVEELEEEVEEAAGGGVGGAGGRMAQIEVCEVHVSTLYSHEARLEGSCIELKQQVSDFIGICKCEFKLVAGIHVVRDGLPGFKRSRQHA